MQNAFQLPSAIVTNITLILHTSRITVIVWIWSVLKKGASVEGLLSSFCGWVMRTLTSSMDESHWLGYWEMGGGSESLEVCLWKVHLIPSNFLCVCVCVCVCVCLYAYHEVNHFALPHVPWHDALMHQAETQKQRSQVTIYGDLWNGEPK
jgi:hypothetical protein